MKQRQKLLIVSAVAVLVLSVLPGVAEAQIWGTTSPALSASVTIPVVRQFNSSGAENLSFGSVMPGTTATVAVTESGTAGDPNSAKVQIRFNAGTSVTVTPPSVLTHANGTATITPTAFSCSVAGDKAGSSATAFACATGHEWDSASVTEMMESFVLIGGSLDAAATASALSGTYTGDITVTLSNSAT